MSFQTRLHYANLRNTKGSMNNAAVQEIEPD